MSPTENKRRCRIVVLCGPNLTHRNTCATLIHAGLDVAGICVANQRTHGIPLAYLRRSFSREGLCATLSHVLARMVYSVPNAGKDRQIMTRIFDEPVIARILRDWNGPVHQTHDYSAQETIAWIDSHRPDILVVHTPYWVGARVRKLARTGIVLGGHPGITPDYRGSHSAFWAIYRGKPQDVGCTVFLVDNGVDTGPIVSQDRIPIERGDSFVTLSWKGMKRIAEMQADALLHLDAGRELPRQVVPVPPGSEYRNPGLLEFLQYRWRQRLVR
jgi:methionyl-tRNA formyltransferase